MQTPHFTVYAPATGERRYVAECSQHGVQQRGTLHNVAVAALEVHARREHGLTSAQIRISNGLIR